MSGSPTRVCFPGSPASTLSIKGKPSKSLNSFGRGFVMASLNIKSLLAHTDDLKIFVTDSKTDILAINETKLDSSIGDSDPKYLYQDSN